MLAYTETNTHTHFLSFIALAHCMILKTKKMPVPLAKFNFIKSFAM